MSHPAEVSEDLFDGMLGARTFRVHYMAGDELGQVVNDRQCSGPFLTGLVSGEEVVGADGLSIGVLQVSLHL